MNYKLNNPDHEYFLSIYPILFLICGILLCLLGIFICIKRYIRLICGLACSTFLGTLSCDIGTMIKCSLLISYSSDDSLLSESETLIDFCYYNADPYILKEAYFALVFSNIIGLTASFLKDPYQRIVIGFGVGSSLVGILNQFRLSLMGIINFNLISSCLFGYIIYRYPSLVPLSINWLISYFIVLGFINIVENSIDLAKFEISDWAHTLVLLFYNILTIGIFIFTSRSCLKVQTQEIPKENDSISENTV